MLAIGGIRIDSYFRGRGEACRIFREGIVVFLELVHLEEVVVPTGRC